MLDWVEIVLRTLLSIVVLFLMTKILGKRQVTQLSFFEYITGISIGNLAAYISLDTDVQWYLGLVSLGVWVTCTLGIEFLQMKSKKMRDFIDSKGTILIREGKIMEDNLKKERLTSDELMEQLRKRSVFKVADVEFAIMEPSGVINVLLTQENQPLTPKHLGIKVAPEKEPQVVIMDGVIVDEPLATMGLSRAWLNTELDKIGVTVENVFLGQVDSYSQLFVDLYDDKLVVPAPQEKAMLFASLKQIEGDLMLYGLSTNNKQAKDMYEQCAKQMEEMISQLKPILQR